MISYNVMFDVLLWMFLLLDAHKIDIVVPM